MRVLDLFSGIGGFSLGLERAGMKTVAFCEIEPYAQRVLAKHWPGVPCYDDVRTLTADRLRADGISVDVICGGFPCQDISTAGHGEGLDGERSALWFEYARLIGEIRPRFVIVENVAALLVRGLDRVLGSLAAIGYDAEWNCIPASAVGAPHRRDRIWIVSYPNNDRCGERPHEYFSGSGRPAPNAGLDESQEPVADANAYDQYRRCGSLQVGWVGRACKTALNGDARGTEWAAEPDVGRMAHGVPSRVDRLGALGNAVVPQIPELIGRAILSAAA